MSEKLKRGDKVYCVLNQMIKGEVLSCITSHGIWRYSVKVKNAKDFEKFIGLKPVNALFLHWQLGKIYKEVKKK